MTRTRTALALAALAVACLTGCSGSQSTAGTPAPTSSASAMATPVDAGLGSMPSYLPSQSGSAVGHGSVDNPALSFPGSPVVVTTPAGSVKVDVEGPSYPATTKVGATSVECTFDVTLSDASAPLALAGAHFDVLDHAGAVHQLKVASGGLPSRIAPGEKVAVKLQATLPSGQGLMRYYPSGQVAAAGWDYVAETD